jgi:acyl-CoA thioester hydrolase
LDIQSWLFDMRRIGATRHYEFRRPSDDALIAQAQGQWVMVDLDSGRPSQVPPQLLADFAPNTANPPQT